MHHQGRRYEVERLVKDGFAIYQEQAVAKRASEDLRVLNDLAKRGNIRSYLPGLTELACEHLRANINTLAKTYVVEFSRFGIPCDLETEREFEQVATQMAAGASSGLCGQLALMERRTRRDLGLASGQGHIHREISASMNFAVRRGKIKLRRQRMMTPEVTIENPGASSANTTVPPRLGHSNVKDRDSQAPIVRETGKLDKETVMATAREPGFPKIMCHATKGSATVYSAQQLADLGAGWTITYEHQPYPKSKYGWEGRALTVANAEEEARLGQGWADSIGAFQPFVGPRRPKEPGQDPTLWVDAWSVPGISPDCRTRIKAQLLRADASFWRSADTPAAFLNPMRLAFDGIAKALSEAGLLTHELLRDAIPELIWDSAIAGGWFRKAPSTPNPIFPEQLGHYWVWRDDGTRWQDLFYSETQEWQAWLLENPTINKSGKHQKPDGTMMPRDQEHEDLQPIERTTRGLESASASRPALTTSQRQRITDAERVLNEAFVAHEKMRELLDPGEWQRSGPRLSEPTIAGEIEKLERDIERCAIEVLKVLAEVAWPVGTVEPFSDRVEIDAGEVHSWVLAKVNRKDRLLIDRKRLKVALDLEVSEWIRKAEREFSPSWMNAAEETPQYDPLAPPLSEREGRELAGRLRVGDSWSSIEAEVASIIAKQVGRIRQRGNLQEVYDSFRLIVAESHDVVAQKCLLASASVPAYERVLGSDVPKLLISVIGERLKNSSDDLQEPETQQFQRALALLLQRIDPSLSTEAATESEKHLYSHLVIPLDNDLAQGRAKWRAEALARKGRAEPAAEGERVSTPAGVVSYSFDFTSNAGKSDAIERYGNHWTTDSWTCSEASLARTARVDPADLSKWKKGSLPSGSDKAKRIEDVLRDNKRPTPTAPRTADT